MIRCHPFKLKECNQPITRKNSESFPIGSECVRRITRTGLSSAVAKAAEQLATQPTLEVGNTSHLQDLAASAARIFGWDSDKPGVQLNQQFVLTQEQIDRIREAAEQ